MDFAIAGFSESRKDFTMSLSPLDVHEYVFGAQSCRNRLI